MLEKFYPLLLIVGDWYSGDVYRSSVAVKSYCNVTNCIELMHPLFSISDGFYTDGLTCVYENLTESSHPFCHKSRVAGSPQSITANRQLIYCPICYNKRHALNPPNSINHCHLYQHKPPNHTWEVFPIQTRTESITAQFSTKRAREHDSTQWKYHIM